MSKITLFLIIHTFLLLPNNNVTFLRLIRKNIFDIVSFVSLFCPVLCERMLM